MTDIVTGSEIVELGIQIEKNGRDFYGDLSRRLKNKSVTQMFKFLSAEEGKHIVSFREILASIRRYEPIESYPAEYFAYINVLAGTYVFTREGKGREMAKGAASEKQAVEAGIAFEKDSILFYEEMKRIMRQEERIVAEGLIEQERRHFEKLVSLNRILREKIKGKKAD